MNSVKRRRGIGFRKWLVVALKDYAKRENLASHTMAASKILRGKISPISSYEKYKNDDRTKQGVSMSEELWLALKVYGKQRGKDESDTQVACKIIVGKIPSIPERCIEEGKCLARQREADRAKDLKPEKSKKIKKKKAGKKKVKKVKDFSEETIEKAGKEDSQERKILDERVKEKHDENGRRLSKGEPFDKKKEAKDRSIKPDGDHYGGIFNL